MTREKFEELAQRAFDSLPDGFKEKIDNVQIVIEDEPDEQTRRQMRVGRGSLLGLYQGVPLNKRGTWYGAVPTVPDKITLYQKAIEASCRSEEEVEKKIVEVLFHEIGHYFGMNEREIRAAMKDFH